MADPDVDFVLFDLGGVLVELGGVSSLQEIAASVGSDEQWRHMLGTPWVRRFETGGCSASEFASQVVAEWGLDVTPERFLEIFRGWPIGPYPGTAELLAELRRSTRIGCLSNTNAVHWEHQMSKWPALDTFDFRFLSFELGLVKPDEAIFRAVAGRLPVRADRILFFDDVVVNVEAARSFGFRSEHVRGIAEVRAVLEEMGMIAA
jgi:glucose-1-phosphatase